MALTTLSRAREFDSLHLARNLPERWVSRIAPLASDFQVSYYGHIGNFTIRSGITVWYNVSPGIWFGWFWQFSSLIWDSHRKWLVSDSVLPDSVFLVIPLFYLCIWFPVWYLFHFILQMGYNFLCFIEFERSANAPSIGEMWLVLSINRLNYRKTLIAAWWNYSWVVDIRRNTKLSIFPLFRRMSAMLEFRHIGISAMLVSAILDLDIIFVFIIINWEFTLILTQS